MFLRIRNSQKYCEQMISSYPRNMVSASLQKLFLRFQALFISHDEVTQYSFSKLPFLSLFHYFVILIVKPAWLTLLSAQEFILLTYIKIHFDDIYNWSRKGCYSRLWTNSTAWNEKQSQERNCIICLEYFIRLTE